MIHVSIHRNPSNEVAEIKLSINEDSIAPFLSMINRALNCWPDTHKDLKDMGDMLTHGRVTQDHSFQRMEPKWNQDYYTPAEQTKIQAYIAEVGEEVWKVMLSQGIAQNKIAHLLK